MITSWLATVLYVALGIGIAVLAMLGHWFWRRKIAAPSTPPSPKRKGKGLRLGTRMKWTLRKMNTERILRVTLNISAWALLAMAVTYGIWHVSWGRTTIVILGSSVLGILLSLPIWFMAAYQSAKHDKQLAFVPTGEIKFKKWGETIVEAIVNVPGRYWDKENDLIVPGEKKNRFARLFENSFGKWVKGFRKDQGIFYVSIFYPMGKIHTWEFDWTKFEPKTHKEGDKEINDGYSVVQKESTVNSLYYQYPYPVCTTEIEIGGNFKVNLLIRVILTVRKPLYLIGNLKGKFMPQLISEVSGILDNALRDVDPEDFRKMDKAAKIKELLPVGKHLLNEAFEVAEASYVSFDWVGNAATVMEALIAQEIEEKQGLARETKAKHDLNVANTQAEERRVRGKADADAKEMLVNVEIKQIQESLAAAASYEGGMDVLRQRALSEGLIGVADKIKPGASLVLGGKALATVGKGGTP